MKAEGSKNYLFVLGDKGSFNYCIPIIKHLRLRGENVLCLISTKLIKRLEALDTNLEEHIVYSEYPLDSLLLEHHFVPDIAVVGTTPTWNLEQRFILDLQKRKISVICPVDTWNLFRNRFSEIHDIKIKEDFCYLPDFIMVVDHYARKQAIQEGVPEEKIIVVGSPHLERLALSYQQVVISQSDKEIREKWGVLPSESIIVFGSEPISKFAHQNSDEYPGFNEIEVLETIVEVLQNLSHPLFLLIKVHPYEKSNSFINQPFLSGIHHTICQDLDPLLAINTADLVIGMTSMFLVEAALLGKPTFSYQPIDRTKDQFFGNASGLTHSCYSPEELEEKINQIASYKRDKNEVPNQFIGSTQKVVEFLDHVIT